MFRVCRKKCVFALEMVYLLYGGSCSFNKERPPPYVCKLSPLVCLFDFCINNEEVAFPFGNPFAFKTPQFWILNYMSSL